MAQTTISVDVETLERFKKFKAQTGDENVSELSADEFVHSLLDSWEESGQSIYGAPEAMRDEITRQLQNEIEALEFDGAISNDKADRMINSLNTIEERTGKLEQQMEDLR